MNIRETLSDIGVMTRRDIIKYFRTPQLLLFSAFFNVILLLLFTYVFGGAIQTGGIDYAQFLLPGFLVSVVFFGSTETSVGIAEDLSKGLVDRFRSLPMARSAFLTGRVFSDTARYIVLLLIMVGVGYAIGFRFEAGTASAVAGIALIVLFGIALTWVSVWIGVLVKSVETAQSAGFFWVFPLVFASSIYVPVETMPSWLQTFAEYNPVTSIVDTIRGLSLGTDIATSLWRNLAWDAGIMLVFVPLAVRRYIQLAR